MRLTAAPRSKLGDIGIQIAWYSFLISVVLSVVHAIFQARAYPLDAAIWTRTVSFLAYDFRYLAEQLILVGVVLFVGARLFETRTTFSVGFEAVDPAVVRVSGPDADNVVWVGQRYDSKFDAEAVAAAFQNRLRDSGAN